MNDETRLKDIINKNKHSKAKLYSLVSFGLIIIIGTLSGLSFAYFNTRVSGNDTSATDSIKIKESVTAADLIISKSPTTTGTINTDGLMKVSQPVTGQTPALTEYRYSGNGDTCNYNVVKLNENLFRESVPCSGTKTVCKFAGNYILINEYLSESDCTGDYFGKVQTIELQPTDSDVKNFVTFNNETWRIIGVFSVDDGTGNYEQRVKIMRDESIGNYSWDSSTRTVNNGCGINEWSQAGLKTELNGIYYNKESGTCYVDSDNTNIPCDFTSKGLNETARNMIADAKWYTSSYDPDGATSSIAYTAERASTTTQCGSFSNYDCAGESVTRNISWTGKIALAYPSDYGYASSDCYAGTQTLDSYSNSTCTSTNWMFNHSNGWFLSPLISVAYISQFWIGYGSVSFATLFDPGEVRPTTYLKPSVKITGGSGTYSDPYTLSL